MSPHPLIYKVAFSWQYKAVYDICVNIRINTNTNRHWVLIIYYVPGTVAGKPRHKFPIGKNNVLEVIVTPSYSGVCIKRTLNCISLICFHVLVNHLVLWEKLPLRASAHFWSWIAWFLIVELYVLYIFWMLAPLLEGSFANIISHLVGCLLVLLIVSFPVQKLFSSI